MYEDATDTMEASDGADGERALYDPFDERIDAAADGSDEGACLCVFQVDQACLGRNKISKPKSRCRLR